MNPGLRAEERGVQELWEPRENKRSQLCAVSRNKPGPSSTLAAGLGASGSSQRRPALGGELSPTDGRRLCGASEALQVPAAAAPHGTGQAANRRLRVRRQQQQAWQFSMDTDRGEEEGRFCSRRWKFCCWLGTGMGRERPAGRTSPSLSTMKRPKKSREQVSQVGQRALPVPHGHPHLIGPGEEQEEEPAGGLD